MAEPCQELVPEGAREGPARFRIREEGRHVIVPPEVEEEADQRHQRRQRESDERDSLPCLIPRSSFT